MHIKEKSHSDYILLLYWPILGIHVCISLCARQKDVNACAGQKNWQCEDFACSQQKDVNDKTPTI